MKGGLRMKWIRNTDNEFIALAPGDKIKLEFSSLDNGVYVDLSDNKVPFTLGYIEKEITEERDWSDKKEELIHALMFFLTDPNDHVFNSHMYLSKREEE